MSSTYPWLSSYEPGVPATVEIPSRTIQQFLTDSVRKYPAKTAVRMVLRYLPLGLAVQARLTYRELDELSSRFAAALAEARAWPSCCPTVRSRSSSTSAS
jgi:long-chain acyl-CoA synthetase